MVQAFLEEECTEPLGKRRAARLSQGEPWQPALFKMGTEESGVGGFPHTFSALKTYDHFFLSFNAAWAAASRAIGTRYGEQDT